MKTTASKLFCAWKWSSVYPHPDDQRPLEVIRAQADAAVNRMAVIACDRTGTERGVNWVGGTVVTDPDSWVLAGGTTTADTHTAIVEVDLALDKCIGGLSDIHNDRRPELYGPVTHAHHTGCAVLGASGDNFSNDLW